MATVTVSLVTKKFDPSGTTFKLKFDCFFDNLSRVFIANQNTCIAAVVIPSVTDKSNLTGTKFELKFVCFFRFLVY